MYNDNNESNSNDINNSINNNKRNSNNKSDSEITIIKLIAITKGTATQEE